MEEILRKVDADFLAMIKKVEDEENSNKMETKGISWPVGNNRRPYSVSLLLLLLLLFLLPCALRGNWMCVERRTIRLHRAHPNATQTTNYRHW